MSSQYECESRLRALGAVAADAPFGAGGNSTTLTKFGSGCLDCATRESWDIVRSCPQAMSRLQSCRGSGGSDGATLAASSCVSALGATDVGELSPSLFGLGPGQGADTRFDGGTCVAFIAEDVLARPLAGKFDSFFNQTLAERGEGPGVVLAFRAEAAQGAASSVEWPESARESGFATDSQRVESSTLLMPGSGSDDGVFRTFEEADDGLVGGLHNGLALADTTGSTAFDAAFLNISGIDQANIQRGPPTFGLTGLSPTERSRCYFNGIDLTGKAQARAGALVAKAAMVNQALLAGSTVAGQLRNSIDGIFGPYVDRPNGRRLAIVLRRTDGSTPMTAAEVEDRPGAFVYVTLPLIAPVRQCFSIPIRIWLRLLVVPALYLIVVAFALMAVGDVLAGLVQYLCFAPILRGGWVRVSNSRVMRNAGLMANLFPLIRGVGAFVTLLVLPLAYGVTEGYGVCLEAESDTGQETYAATVTVMFIQAISVFSCVCCTNAFTEVVMLPDGAFLTPPDSHNEGRRPKDEVGVRHDPLSAALGLPAQTGNGNGRNNQSRASTGSQPGGCVMALESTAKCLNRFPHGGFCVSPGQRCGRADVLTKIAMATSFSWMCSAMQVAPLLCSACRTASRVMTAFLAGKRAATRQVVCCGAAGARKCGQSCCQYVCCTCIGTVRCCDNICSRCSRGLRTAVSGCLGLLCCRQCKLCSDACGACVVGVRGCCTYGVGGLFCCGGLMCGAHGFVPVCGTVCGDVEEQEYLSLRPNHADSDGEDEEPLAQRPRLSEDEARAALVYTAKGSINDNLVAASGVYEMEAFDVDRDRVALAWRRSVKRHLGSQAL